MKYEDLYNDFKRDIFEGKEFYEKKEKENSIDESVGMHIIFGLVVVPYIIYLLQIKDISTLKKIFKFLERMAISRDIKVNEVLDFTILEQLADEGHDLLFQCKPYMGTNTLQHCEEIEKYFY